MNGSLPSRPAPRPKWFLRYTAGGVLVMIAVVHPLLEWIHHWRSGHGQDFTWAGSWWRAVGDAFSPGMWPMTLLLAGLGALAGAVLAFLHRRLLLRRPPGRYNVPLTAARLTEWIASGENEELEFKSSLRWDRKLGDVNKALEQVIAKTICGFMNHHGGVLLIGVDDNGELTGIEDDWKTLRQPDCDHFGQKLVSLVMAQLGASAATRLHCEYLETAGTTVAAVKVEPAPTPVFCKDGNAQRYYLRAGNTTRELDTREAVAHIGERKAKR